MIEETKMNKAEITFYKYSAYGTSVGDYVSYGGNLLRHKADIYSAGRDIDVPRWTLVKHDIDKFSPSMFKTYAEWFYGPEGKKGTKNPELKKKWRAQVQKHYERSPHHAHKLGKPQNVTTELESVADSYSAHKRSLGWPKKFPDIKQWLKPRVDKLKISDEAKQILRDKS